MSNKQQRLHAELEDFIVNVGWTHKIHIVQSDLYVQNSLQFKKVRIIIAALTSSGLIGLLFVDHSFVWNLVTTVLSFVTVAMNGFDRATDYEKLSVKEKTDANNFWKLRINAESLLYDTVYNTQSMTTIEIKFAELTELRNQYNDGLLNVSKKAVNLARDMINNRKDNDYSNDYSKFISPDLFAVKVEDHVHDDGKIF